MTKPNFTSINVLIDRSGSMQHLTNDTIGGFNSFLQEQKEVPGEAILSLCLFDTSSQTIHDCLPLALVPDLDKATYRPGGGTALLDALGAVINSTGARLAAMNEEDRPSKVIFLLITDGQENSSTEFAIERIKDMVTHQREVYSWEFVFMGANIDSISAGTSLGISVANSLNYTASSVGTKGLYANVSASLRSYRSGNSSQVDFFNQPPVVVDIQPPVDVQAPVVNAQTPVVQSSDTVVSNK
jgi:hypothetical protein